MFDEYNEYHYRKAKKKVNTRSPEEIYNLGLKGETVVSYDALLTALIEADHNGEWILKAGMKWPKFNFKKGISALIQVDHGCERVLRAGKEWKHFDFNMGETKLIQYARNHSGGFGTYSGSNSLYRAGLDWPKFDYARGLEALKKYSKKYYYLAKSHWPKSGQSWKEPKEPNEDDPTYVRKPYKPRGYRSDDDSEWSRAPVNPQHKFWPSPVEIFKKGENNPKEALDQLIHALTVNPHEAAKYIIQAGSNWKSFDYRKAINALKRINLKVPKETRRYYHPHEDEPEKTYFDLALETWPRGVEQIKDLVADLKLKSNKMEKKPFGLKESLARKFQPKWSQDPVDILMNPDLGEIKRMAYTFDKDAHQFEMRGLMDKQGNLYVTPACGLSHREIENALNLTVAETIRLVITYRMGEVTNIYVYEKYGKLNTRKEVMSNPNINRIASPSAFNEAFDLERNVGERNKPKQVTTHEIFVMCREYNKVHGERKAIIPSAPTLAGVAQMARKYMAKGWVPIAYTVAEKGDPEKGDPAGRFRILVVDKSDVVPVEFTEDFGFMFPGHDIGSTGFMSGQHIEQERRKRKGKKPKNPEKIESVEKEAKTFNKELLGQPWKSKRLREDSQWKKPGEVANISSETLYFQGTDQEIQNDLKWDANDWKVAQNKLMAGDLTGKWTTYAGRDWPHFNYEMGWEHLGNKEESWYRTAMRWWPKGIEGTEQATKEMKASSVKMPKKPFGLKEDFNTDGSQNGLFADTEMKLDLEKGTKASMKRYQKKTKGALKTKKHSMVIPASDAHTIDRNESVIDLNRRVKKLCEIYDEPEKPAAKKGKVSYGIPSNKTKLNEALQMIRFHYSNYKHEPPIKNVKILDVEYPGQVGQKTYGKRKDLLGWDLNEYGNKEEAARSIDEIDSFARLLTADNLEKYRRIKVLYPEQAKLIRRYIREFCKGLRVKKEDGLWKSTNFEEIKRLNDESF